MNHGWQSESTLKAKVVGFVLVGNWLEWLQWLQGSPHPTAAGCSVAYCSCNSSSLIWPAGSVPAALARLLFNPPEPQTIGKKKRSESRLPYLFAHLHLLASAHSFSSLIFSLLDFFSLTLPTSAFPSLQIVGSLTSRLSSII